MPGGGPEEGAVETAAVPGGHLSHMDEEGLSGKSERRLRIGHARRAEISLRHLERRRDPVEIGRQELRLAQRAHPYVGQAGIVDEDAAARVAVQVLHHAGPRLADHQESAVLRPPLEPDRTHHRPAVRHRGGDLREDGARGQERIALLDGHPSPAIRCHRHGASLRSGRGHGRRNTRPSLGAEG